ncbi:MULTISPECIES: hypothetical protein [Micromonospora]|uniref:CopG family transcriptional regulator n=1 Tax=Micromonospora solifontis TaxID=2487138 RepID=A0ABX9WEB0_9ACTN|nr:MULTISPECIES: hypothetical protein [Micromonospora]NES13880.1 hypothetical protein [Micromonospora sp. PPF5-17B]NES37949.1 hypothetical protein [Micromonospora solifontis]NES53980.1 hypothetical protein [Micromonospora sp. PPF5-6]RNL97798.1 hypothetical protein EFE23_17590 [Micromonospora solifontis]
MTRRITISLPDDVAAYVERTQGNTSGFIAGILRRKMRADSLRARWAQLGYLVTDQDVERTRARLAAQPPISDEQHARNLEWLSRFDDEGTAGA